ncbi:MAG: pilus assembly PilX family protein [Pseudomonadota bacterium]
MNHNSACATHGVAGSAQQGMALITVLVMLMVASMLGISAFQAGLTQERITGNQRVGMLARMAAEAAVVEGRSAFQTNATATLDLDDLEEDAPLPWVTETVTDDGLPESRLDYLLLRQPAAESLTGLSLAPGTYVLGRGTIGSGNPVQRQVLSQVAASLPLPDLEAVFTCYGPGCSMDVKDNNAKKYPLDGANHPLPEDFACTGKHCRTTPAADRELSLDVEDVKFYDPDKDDDFAASRKQWLDFVAGLPDPVASYGGEDEDNKILPHGNRQAPVVIEVNAGKTVNLNGDAPTAGVILVRDGGVLGKANGTAHHEGLIIVEPGGRLELANGTFNLYGGIVSLESLNAGLDKDDASANTEADLAAGGNTQLQYSLDAIELLGGLQQSGSGGSVISWQELP